MTAKKSNKKRPPLRIKVPKKKGTRKKDGIPARQLEMPVGFGPDGNLRSLQEILDAPPTLKKLSTLTSTELASLTIERIRKLPDFKVAMVGVGELGPEDAIREIQAGTPVGQDLIELERRLVRNLLEKAKK